MLMSTPTFDLAPPASHCHFPHELCAGAVYLSPILQSATGSQHGYDVVDFSRVDVARGGDAGWRAFLSAARQYGLDVVVDIVPNHTGGADAAENAPWWSGLRDGPSSPYARGFDIDWSSRPLRLPVLG